MKCKRVSRMIKSAAVLLIVGFGFMLCTTPMPAFAQDKAVYKARLSYHWFPGHHSAIYSEKFAQYCREETKGRLDIQTYPSGQLYDIRSALGAVSQGAVEIAAIVDVIFIAVDRNFVLGGLPYLFDSYEEQRSVFEETPGGRAVHKAVQDKLGIKFLGYNPVGPSYVWSTNKPLRRIEDYRGQKSRYLSTAELPAIKALGEVGVSVPTQEMYTALQSGMLNTFSTVPSAVKAYSWWDFAKFVNMPTTVFSDAYMVANARWFNSLPKDIQESILKVGKRITKEATESIMQVSQSDIAEFKQKHGGAIVQPSPEELARFKKFARDNIYPPLIKNMNPDLWEGAKKITQYKE